MATLQTKLHLSQLSRPSEAAAETIAIRVHGQWVQAPVLRVNNQNIVITGKRIRIAALHEEEWLESQVEDPQVCIQKLKAPPPGPRADIFRFAQKVPATLPRYGYPVEMSSVAVARITTFKNWWERVPLNTRQNIKHSQERGVVVKLRAFEPDVIQGISTLQNETPVRPQKTYPPDGESFDQVRRDHSSFLDRSDFLCAYVEDEFIGFLKLVYRGKVASIQQLNVTTAHADKCPASALLAKAVERCQARGVSWLTYGNFNDCRKGADSLCPFKVLHGFSELMMPTYYVPLTAWGRLSVLLKLYRTSQPIVPPALRAILRKLRAQCSALFPSRSHRNPHPTSPTGD